MLPGVAPGRLPHVTTTIFSIMSGLALEHQAINLGQGFPSFQPDEALRQLIAQAMMDGHNQYAPMEGLLKLREAISEKVGLLYGYIPDPLSEITVTSGGTEALFNAIAACIELPGDEVIILPPCYDSYGPAILLNGGRVVEVPLTTPDFKPDLDAIKAAISPRTKAIVFNTPHNPTGVVWSEEEVLALGHLAETYDIALIADEVYEHITFDGLHHASLLRYPNLFSRSFVVHSFGKTFHATGFKTGYCIAPAQLTKAFRKVHQYVTFSTFTPIQHGLAHYLLNPENYAGLGPMYQQRRDALLKAFEGTGLKPLPCQGTYFQLFDYTALSDEDDQEFARTLVKTAKVASIPVSSFYSQAPDQKLLRFCFAKDEALLVEAGHRIRTSFA